MFKKGDRQGKVENGQSLHIWKREVKGDQFRTFQVK